MKKEQINIRDPFVMYENGVYYLYGTRAAHFGCCTGGFDVYTSDDLREWSAPVACFDSAKYGLNIKANWAPEVHEYKGKYYMLATFTRDNGLRGTFSLVSESPSGPFAPNSKGALTPFEWECLDGTLYVDKSGVPYLVFCHEHTQIKDGTICYVRLSENLDAAEGEVITLFSASSCQWVDPVPYGHFVKEDHYVTDGPFLYRSKTDELFMIWSSFVKGNYAEFAVKFKDGELGTEFEHQPPLLDSDGGHGMIFSNGEKTYFTYHTPNKSGDERPEFCLLEDRGDTIAIKK